MSLSFTGLIKTNHHMILCFHDHMEKAFRKHCKKRENAQGEDNVRNAAYVRNKISNGKKCRTCVFAIAASISNTFQVLFPYPTKNVKQI